MLTNTNDEALRILRLLLKNGKKAKLVQSLDGFRLYNLVEIRAFLNSIDRNLKSPVISDDIWENAKSTLYRKYHDSSCMDNVQRLISDFEETHSVKYRTDFEEYLKESKYEGFYKTHEQQTIYVSTIHKAKGRDFETVYMLLKNVSDDSDERRRALYVAMTRAKCNLYIHTNTHQFDQYNIPGVKHFSDDLVYEEPREILLQTTHRDVVLDFFKGKKKIIFSLRSGELLKIDDIYLTAERNGNDVRVAKFSKSFVDRLTKLKNRGYSMQYAQIQFVVAWKGENDDEETPILLTYLYLRK